MPNYKATFFTFFCGSADEMDDVEDANTIHRVFEAQSLDCARKIAEAMVGEGMYYLEHLHRVTSVQETTEAVYLCSWNPAQSWWGAYRRLREDGEPVKVKLDAQENPVGIFFEK